MAKIRIITDKPVAFDSPDHLHPWGTARDNSVSRAFNRKLHWWLGKKIKLLDLGCSGGGFVKSLLDQGDFAIGIEGSDYSKIRERAEWATIPDYLFTADITEPFTIIEHNQSMQFDVITAWEVLEHVEESKLGAVFENIKKHLAPQGVVIFSITVVPEVISGVHLHQTVKSETGWAFIFQKLGFKDHSWVRNYFGYDWVRRPDIGDKTSFNVVLTRKDEQLVHEKRLKYLVAIFVQLNLIKEISKMGIKKAYDKSPELVKQIYRQYIKKS